MKRKRAPEPDVGGYATPPELLDRDAVVWIDRAAHLAFMAEHGWRLSVRDRFTGSHTGASPKVRRQAAVVGWAEEHGITTSPGGHADWHRLRALGVIE